MAEKKEATKAESAEKPSKVAKKTIEDTPGMVVKSNKPKWTVERAMKTARRFETEDAWCAGAPASYKAAMAHGWVAACTRHMNSKSKPMRRSA